MVGSPMTVAYAPWLKQQRSIMDYTNKYNLPDSIVRALTANTYDLSKATANVFSATTLISPPKITELSRRHWADLVEDASENVWRLFGSSVHFVMDKAAGVNTLTEERINVRMPEGEVCKKLDKDGLFVSGKPDHYEGFNDDYKVTSVWSIVLEPKGKPDWHSQLNIYDWLWYKVGFESKGLRVIAILRDWSRRESLKNKDYPPIPLAVVNIPKWTHEEQEEYIKQRLRLHQSVKKLTDDEIPHCSFAERWEKPTVYAMMKGKNVRSIKNFAEKNLALQAIASAGKEYYLQTRPGKPVRCYDYCPVNKHCSYYIDNLMSKGGSNERKTEQA